MFHLIFDNKIYPNYLNYNLNFILVFELNSSNSPYLEKVLNDCLKFSNFEGIIFVINKNEIYFSKIMFFKDIIIQLYLNKKKIGLFGLPHCFKIKLFGGFDYMRFSSLLILENSKYFSKYLPYYQNYSSQLKKCIICSKSDVCDGLGSIKENYSLWSFRASHKYRNKNIENLFQSKDNLIKNSFKNFQNHILKFDLETTDRMVQFVQNIDNGSINSFSDRFLYFCYYLSEKEFKLEFDFLKTQVINKKYLDVLISKIKNFQLKTFAFSLAKKKNLIRETFYFYPVQNYDILTDLNLNLNYFKNYSKPYVVGIDIIDNEISSYKVYFKSTLENIKKEIGDLKFDFEKIKVKEYLIVFRLDKNLKLISKRIDVPFNFEDINLYLDYFPQMKNIQTKLNNVHLGYISFEYKNEKIIKSNIYYRNNYLNY